MSISFKKKIQNCYHSKKKNTHNTPKLVIRESQLHFFLINLFIYLFLAVLGLHCCAQAFPSCGERGLLFVAVRGLLIVMASLVAEHGLQARRLQ